jgi:hypothetical protein
MQRKISTMPTRYRVQIHSDGHQYRTTGAIAISTSARPMIDAAKALLEAGADPFSRLAGVYEGAHISPVALGRLVKPYRVPKTDHRIGTGIRNAA